MDRRTFLAATAGGMAAFLADSPVRAGLFGKKTIKWQRNYGDARQAAAAKGRPMLVVFGASWCTFCHKLERETLGDSAIVRQVERQFVPVHLDYDKDEDIAQSLDVESLPCSLVVLPNGDVVVKKVGFMKPAEYRKLLDDALEQMAAPAGRVQPASGRR